MSRRRRRKPGSTRARWRSAGSVALIAITLVLIIGGLFSIKYLESPSIDERTLCPEETGPVAGLVILLDLTDPIGRTQHARLRGILDRAIADAAPDTLIAVGTVGSDADGSDSAFARCKPLEGSRANELYENPRLVEERYRKEFQYPLEKSLEEMLTAKDAAPQSPIMESLQAVLVAAPGFLDAKYHRRVIIVSDLLQHSTAFSFYRGGAWRTFERSADFHRLAGNLHGVDVEIHRLPRPNVNVDRDDVDDFWINYFEQAGVRSVDTKVIGDL